MDILAYLDPNKFYRLKIDQQTMDAVAGAKSYVDINGGESCIITSAHRLGLHTFETCNIIITPEKAFPTIDGENLLEADDNILTLPEVYLTRRFRIMLDDAKKYLTARDSELIAIWQKNEKKI